MPIQNHTSGIYCIICLVNSKRYIGQTFSLTTRWRQHKCNLKADRHGNKFLQRDFNLYGLTNFMFVGLEECDIKEFGDERENYWINLYNTTDRSYGYNVNYGGRNSHTCTDETKLQMSICRKGKPSNRKGSTLSEETKMKISAAKMGSVSGFKGRKHGEESKLKNSLSKKGKPSCRKGVVLSEETRAKISSSKKGQSPPNKGVPMSQEQKDKLSLAHKGREAPNKGKPMSDEQKIKLKLAWIKRKARSLENLNI